ncbi:kinesin heavy chain-like [Venturia canescens]|uniref:kinesin heavy chain-like n=1 Tax=Venturia canescens TaxID=32260 RepID=UPI001C9D09EE|nr:kinesin heavy chain-like [Venturia canescens]
MVKNAITVFARLKPEKSRKRTVNYKIHRKPKKHCNEDFLVLTVPCRSLEYIDNRPETWNFSFHGIFNHDAQQQDIFESVARPIVDSVFDGYNATIFAYGQTGSGKTYTVTGDLGSHGERGIIPRTLQYIFDVVRKNPENLYSIEIAYLEIYNENGYDLLLERKQREAASRIEDLPRVTIHEDENGGLHLKNLSFRIVENESDALQFLSDGDSCRAISETPMNPRSSRSHCIFTIVVSVKKIGSDRYSSAKMHLVDLAGSERVYKCAIQGTILTEAKHINLSLHFLEQVIVCLGQENVSHVPYRNSLLTSILRDSLGGNCLTTMLANLSVSSFNLEETISTCRFAQRVALVKNDVNLTLVLDTKSENKLLKMENEKLRKQIEELQKQKAPEISCWDSPPGTLEHYKNLVLQRDQEILSPSPTERSQEEKSVQMPTARISPTRSGPPSPPRMKTRRKSMNSLRTKPHTSPKSFEMLGRCTPEEKRTQMISPKRPAPNVPPLTLDHDEIEINDRHCSSGALINGETCRVEKKIDEIEPEVTKLAEAGTDSSEVRIDRGNSFEKLIPLCQSPIRKNLTKFNNFSNLNISTGKEERAEQGSKEMEKNERLENLPGEKSPQEGPHGDLEKIRRSLQAEKNERSGEASGREKSPKEAVKYLRKSAPPESCREEKSPGRKRSGSFLKEWQKSSHDEKPHKEESPRTKSPKFPQNVMRMMRTSRTRNPKDDEENSPSSSKSETPRSGFKTTSNILRNILCIEKNSNPQTNIQMDRFSTEPNQAHEEPQSPKDFANLPLTGDPEIDEEIVAFYRAKRGEGTY